MATLPESQHTTAHAIVKWYESKPQEHRPHMGASLIGHPCERYIWLTWRWALKPEFKGRILRLFSTGQREEPRLIEELRGIGAEVWDTDPATGDQWRVTAHNGHFGGSLDGVAKGVPEAPKTPCVLEFKTHSAKSWNDVSKKHVQVSKPQHYAQMQIYMGLMELDRALYIAVNKDTDDIYTEWVHFNKDRFDQLMERAKRLIESSVPPLRMSNDPEHFECKWCGMWKLCHGGQAAEANCRTCSFASPVEDSKWHCARHSTPTSETFISEKVQRDGCKDHLLIPDLVPYGEPQDGGDNWIAYKHKTTGKYFVNGSEKIEEYGPVFSSKELHNCNGSLIADVIATKNEFPVSRVVSGTTNGPDIPMVTMWDDLATHPDDIPVKPDHPIKREEAKKARAAAKAIMGMTK